MAAIALGAVGAGIGAAAVAQGRSSPSAAAREVSIAATGDVLAHGNVEATARRYASRGGYEWVLGAVRASVERADVAFVNLETPLTKRYRDVDTRRWPPTLGSDYGLERAMARVGFDVVSVANNHALDQTESGLAETVSKLREARLGVIGAGPTVDDAYGAWVVERNGVRIAFVAFTEPMNPVSGVRARRVGAGGRMLVARLWDTERVEAALRRARAQADVVVASVHWGGSEQLESPGRGQRRRVREMVDAGADVVLGHGPHRLHPVERMQSARGDAVVAYSLGNLVSNMGYRYRQGMRLSGMTHSSNGHPGNRDAVVLGMRISVPSEGRVTIGAVTADRYWTENEERDGVREVRLVPLGEVPSPLREEREAAIREALGPTMGVAGIGGAASSARAE